jgi:hypothetical protein
MIVIIEELLIIAIAFIVITLVLKAIEYLKGD